VKDPFGHQTKLMNMKASIILSFLLFGSLFFYGCKKTEDSPTSTPTIGHGDVTGTIAVYNEQGRIFGSTGVIVTIDETGQFVEADTTGNWAILNVEEGKKTITFSKFGYSTYKLVDVTINKDQTNNILTKNIFKKPSFYVTNLNVTLNSGAINITGHITDVTFHGFYIVLHFFVSTNSNVSKIPNSYQYHTKHDITHNGNINFSENISLSTLYNAGFPASSTIYLVAYSDYSGQYYLDKVTGKTFYSSLCDSASNVVSVTLP